MKRGRPCKILPAEAFSLAQQGFTCAQIAAQLGLNYHTIYRWAAHENIVLARGDRGRPARNAALVLELARAGVFRRAIAVQTGYSYVGVCAILNRSGVDARYQPSPRDIEREEKMASMYRQGLTLEKIGGHFKITRERVRQILSRSGVSAAEGGSSKVTESKRKAKQDQRNADALATYGLTFEEVRLRKKDKTLNVFLRQRRTAGARGVDWRLRFSDWLAVWLESGKLAQRGRGKGKYVMSRIRDEGGYALGNVHIQLSTDNNREGIAGCRHHKAANAGVYMTYPGTKKPWVAVGRRRFLGTFATADEALQVRKDFYASLGIPLPNQQRNAIAAQSSGAELPQAQPAMTRSAPARVSLESEAI